MIAGMKELLLPPGLLDDILPILRTKIHYNSKENDSLLTSVQAYIEDVTALPWDWWPLPPRMRKLKADETHIHWHWYAEVYAFRIRATVNRE
jgi:hypothetical protein